MTRVEKNKLAVAHGTVGSELQPAHVTSTAADDVDSTSSDVVVNGCHSDTTAEKHQHDPRFEPAKASPTAVGGGLVSFFKESIGRPACSVLTGMYSASDELFNTLDQWSRFIEEKTGLKRGGAFEKISADQEAWADYFRDRGLDPAAGGVTAVAAYLYEGTGRMSVDLPVIAALGLPSYSAMSGGARAIENDDSVAAGTATGFVHGLLLHGILRGAGQLPIPERIGTAGVVFGGESLRAELTRPEGEREYERVVADFLIGAGLVGFKPGLTRKEVLQDIRAAYGRQLTRAAGELQAAVAHLESTSGATTTQRTSNTTVPRPRSEDLPATHAQRGEGSTELPATHAQAGSTELPATHVQNEGSATVPRPRNDELPTKPRKPPLGDLAEGMKPLKDLRPEDLHNALAALQLALPAGLALDLGPLLRGIELPKQRRSIDEIRLRRKMKIVETQNPETARSRGALAKKPVSTEALARDMSVLENALSDGSVRVVHQTALGGGINTTQIVVLSNGVKAVWKPSKGENMKELRVNLEKDHQARREAAAYVIDKAMGHPGRVPPTVFRTLNGEEGALMVFVEGQHSRTRNLASGETSRGSFLDNVLGNLDRHSGNYLVTKDGMLVPIDHGLTLPLKNGSQGWHNHQFDWSHRLPAQRIAALQRLIQKRDEVTRELSDLDISPKAIRALFDRVEMMLRAGEAGHSWADPMPADQILAALRNMR